MNKTDRLITTLSIGILLISSVYTMTTIRQQNIEKENARLAFEEKAVIGTQDVMIWRHYHEEQMNVLNAILNELRKNKTQTIRTTQCL